MDYANCTLDPLDLAQLFVMVECMVQRVGRLRLWRCVLGAGCVMVLTRLNCSCVMLCRLKCEDVSGFLATRQQPLAIAVKCQSAAFVWCASIYLRGRLVLTRVGHLFLTERDLVLSRLPELRSRSAAVRHRVRICKAAESSASFRSSTSHCRLELKLKTCLISSIKQSLHRLRMRGNRSRRFTIGLRVVP